MAPIKYKSNSLYIEGLSVEKLADDNQTPFYCYSEKYIEDQYQALISAFNMDVKIFYSMKANSNISILKVLLNKGSGIDVVSGGEIERAITAGASGRDIIYAGVGKTDEDQPDIPILSLKEARISLILRTIIVVVNITTCFFIMANIIKNW